MSAAQAKADAVNHTPGQVAATKIFADWRGNGAAELNNAAFRIGLLVSAGLLKHSRAVHLLDFHMTAHRYDSIHTSMSRESLERGVATVVMPADLAPPAANDNSAPADDTIDADTLLGMDFPPLAYVGPGYVVEGLTVLGGKPKLGKSWWAYDVGIAVATGGRAMGHVQCEPGDVLYLALEDNWRRVKNPINVVRPLSKKRGGLSRLKVRTVAPRIDDGLIAELEKWRSTAANPRLIIIDVYMKVRPLRKRGEDSYAADYAAVELHHRYGKGIMAVADSQIRLNVGLDRTLELPSTCCWR